MLIFSSVYLQKLYNTAPGVSQVRGFLGIKRGLEGDDEECDGRDDEVEADAVVVVGGEVRLAAPVASPPTPAPRLPLLSNTLLRACPADGVLRGLPPAMSTPFVGAAVEGRRGAAVVAVAPGVSSLG